MAAAGSSWKVFPHDAIEVLEDDLWRVEAVIPKYSLRRTMTLARLDDGRLVIHSAIALDDASMARIEAWGKPAFLLVPSRYHRLDAPAYKRRYPDLCVLCPRGAKSAVEQRLGVDGDYEAFPAGQRVRLRQLAGTSAREGVMFIDHGAGTSLVFNDLVFNMSHLKGMRGLVLRYLTQSSGGPRMSLIGRAFIMTDRARLKSELLQLAETPRLRRILVAHHRVIDDNPAGVLREIAQRL